MSGTEHLHVEERDGIAVVRIDRPPANAMDVGMLEEGDALLDQLAADLPTAVVITGREEFFSAGLDLKAMPALDADGQRAMLMGVNRLFTGWYSFPRPLVCAVNGHAVAGGLILALCGDYRVGPTEGKFGLTELRAGVAYPAAAMAVVRAELTAAAARRLALGAALVGPADALELGVVDELSDAAGMLDRALEVAHELAALPAGAYELVKHQVRAETIAYCRRIVDEEADPILDLSWVSTETPEAARSVLRGDGR